MLILSAIQLEKKLSDIDFQKDMVRILLVIMTKCAQIIVG